MKKDMLDAPPLFCLALRARKFVALIPRVETTRLPFLQSSFLHFQTFQQTTQNISNSDSVLGRIYRLFFVDWKDKRRIYNFEGIWKDFLRNLEEFLEIRQNI